MSAAATAAVTPSPPEALSMKAVLALPAMRRMWYAQIVSVFGDFLALVAVISVMTFTLHANPRQIIGVQIAYLLPIAILGIIAGVFVDRWHPQRTLVTSDLLRAGLCLLLLLVHNVWGFYAVLASISIVSSFFNPAQGVAIRSVVPLHGLRSANALVQQVMFLMRIIGPFAAAFLVTHFTAKSCYIVDSLSFVASGSLIASLALAAPDRGTRPKPTETEAQGLERVWLDMKQGISFIVHHAALSFVILALAAGMFVMGCFGPLIAVYVRDILHASIKLFGWASPLVGLGLLLGVSILNAAGKRLSNNTLVYAGLGGIAVGVGLMAAVPRPAAALIGCFLVGFAAAGIIIPSQTLIQQETPQALLGRVGSTVMSVIFTAQIGGLVLSGLLTRVMDVRWVFTVCAGLLVVLIAAGKLFMEPEEQVAASAATSL